MFGVDCFPTLVGLYSDIGYCECWCGLVWVVLAYGVCAFYLVFGCL